MMQASWWLAAPDNMVFSSRVATSFAEPLPDEECSEKGSTLRCMRGRLPTRTISAGTRVTRLAAWTSCTVSFRYELSASVRL
jgi:hypothetical protein